jgi:hypothetical protein
LYFQLFGQLIAPALALFRLRLQPDLLRLGDAIWSIVCFVSECCANAESWNAGTIPRTITKGNNIAMANKVLDPDG